MRKISRAILILLFIFFILATSVIIKIFYDQQNRFCLEIVFLDVGQGDSIFIQAPNGYQTLLDAGPNSDIVRALSEFLPYYDRSIDLLIASHSDADHVAGFVDILERFEIGTYGRNYFDDTDALSVEISKLILEKNVDLVSLGAGDQIFLDRQRNIFIEILWPPPDHLEEDNNDNSVVVRVVYDEVEFLLTGDASVEIEKKLIQNFATDTNANTLVHVDSQNNLQSNILKAGHHGSRTSTHSTFLDAVNPDYVIISAGEDNRFGHPHQEVIDLINKKSIQRQAQNGPEIKILETSQRGSIHFKTDGKKLWLVK